VPVSKEPAPKCTLARSRRPDKMLLADAAMRRAMGTETDSPSRKTVACL
jgi:hypothetical protein